MAISQSVLDNAAAAMISSMLPKAPLEVAIGQSVALQAKTTGIDTAGEKGQALLTAAVTARDAMKTWANDDPLKLATERMLVTLMDATGEVGAQAASTKLPK